MREQDPQVRAHNFQEVPLGYSEEEARNEAARCLHCAKPMCVTGCPVHIDIPKFYFSSSALKINGLDISTQGSAQSSKSIIEKAGQYVTSIRAEYGALQSELEHTYNFVGYIHENLTQAESTIRDADMAEEMMGFVKNQIISQAATAMLSQANQTPQGILSMLQ